MTMLLDSPRLVQSDLLDAEPFMSPEDCRPDPSPADEAYLIAFNAAYEGEPARMPRPGRGRTPEVMLRHAMGTLEGQRARQVAEARELGRALGYSGSGISEPPAGLLPHEKAAYREGFALGTAEFEEDREFEAWVASNEAERMEAHFGAGLADADVYPFGGVS